MSWDLLNQEIDKYVERQRILEQIAAIVQQHPEWQQSEPQLIQLLKAVEKKSA